MGRKIRFIHAADVHMGAPLAGLRDADSNWSDLLQGAISKAWERVVHAALTREVDFVILAGDMFDTSRPSYGDYRRFFEGLEQLDAAGVSVYQVAGNHDPYTVWERDIALFPPSARLLGVESAQFALYEREGEPLCLIGGRSYYNQAWPENEGIASGISRAAAVASLARDFPRANEAPFSIGVVHTGLAPDQSKAKVDLDELLEADIDYWACGHLHDRTAFPDAQNPRVVFPGSVQGLNMGETGERGCYLVQMEEQPCGAGCPPKVSLEFVPTSGIVLQRLVVDVSACQTLADVRRLLQAELFHESGKVHCDEMVTRITLTGATPLHEFLVKRDMVNEMRLQINNAYPGFFCDALEDRTRFPGDEAHARESNGYFPEIVAAIAEEQRSRETALVNFLQSEFVKRGITVPSSLSGNLDELTGEAENLVQDLLREDAE